MGHLGKCCLFMCVSVVSYSATPRTVVHQASLSRGFSRQNTGVGCRFLQMRAKVTWEFWRDIWLRGELPKNQLTDLCRQRGAMAVRRAWIFFKGKGLLEPGPGTVCFLCPCASALRRERAAPTWGWMENFWYYFLARRGRGVDHRQALGSDPHGKPPKGPRERGALGSRGAWAAARPPRVSRVLQGGLCVRSRSPRLAGGDAGGEGPGIPPTGRWQRVRPTLVVLTFGCLVNSLEFWADLKTLDFSASTLCTGSHQPCFEEKPAPHLWPTSGALQRLWP